MIKPAGESIGEPSSIEAAADGAIKSATPVPASRTAVVVSNDFMSCF